MKERIIFHIDVNSAFLSWEAVYRLKVLGEETDLRKIPSAVAGDIEKRHGIILARSHPAKLYGVKTAETIGDAKKKCPDLVLVPPNHALYNEYSKAFINVLERFSPVIQQTSIDEAYCDMTGTMGLYGTPIAAANLIKDTIENELGFTVSIGVSNNKLLAKMASDLRKPNFVNTLFPEEIKDKMWPLPVSDLFYVGRSTTKKLLSLGIETIGDLANADKQILNSHFKKYGEVIHSFANGIDLSEVTGIPQDNKGYGNSTTISSDIDDKNEAHHVLLSLCETVGARLRSDKVRAGVIKVSIVYYDFSSQSHQMTLIDPTNITNELYENACGLFDELWNGIPVRNLGVYTTKVENSDEFTQMSLFSGKKDQHEKLDETIDKIRKKYGDESVTRGSFLEKRIRTKR